MSEIALQVNGLGKQYRLGRSKERYSTLRDQVGRMASASIRTLLRRGERAGRHTPFWALKDVSFEVKRGEVVGIIGRNGAGKSTLLKILSRITEPTEGEADIHGRVGSLLEVGTGFHPELSGRENVFLNGAILGMRRAEVARKFDEIVSFAEVEKFIDTPVKHYSSGMYMKLAFAVAAHLEPEIFIVDEVLAVGDAQFQQKCLGKMGQVAGEGRTVLFVSHNLSTIQGLCRTALVLEKGSVAWNGPSAQAVAYYLSQHAPGHIFRRDRVPDGIGILSAEIELNDAESDTGPVISLSLMIKSDRSTAITVDFRLTDRIGSPVAFGSLGTLDPTSLVSLKPGMNRVVGKFSGLDLAVGGYSVGIDLTYPDADYFDRVDNCVAFEILSPPRPPAVRRTLQQWGLGSCEFRSALVSSESTQDFG